MDVEVSALRRNILQLIKEFDYQQKKLKEKPLKELVSLVRNTNGIFSAFVDALFEHLRRDDCDVRLGVLLIANHFFQRSHQFRLELINSLQDFLVYTLETNPVHYSLPKPTEAAALLKKETLSMLHLWIEKFGAGYVKLEKLQHFLKDSKSLDWAGSRAELLIDREREDQKRFEREVKTRKIVEHFSSLYEESRTEIERLLVEAHNIIEILYPKFCPLEDEKGARSSQNSNGQLHAFEALNEFTVCINADEMEIDRTEENEDLLNQLKDTTKELERWHAKLGKWLKKLMEIGNSSPMMRRIIDLRHAMGEELQKCHEFRVNKGQNGDETDSDQSDFVDVEEKEGFEPGIHDEKQRKEPVITHFGQLLDDRPGPSNKIGREDERKLTTKEKKRSQSKNCVVPKLAMGLDLKYWGQDEIKPAERPRNQAEGHQFWRPIDDDVDNVPTEHLESYRVRQITFIGEQQLIRRRCRAPLPSGKLCPRMERDRCALHGPIIDRDEMGYPMKEQKSEEERLQNEACSEAERKQREDAEYLRDVEEVTGAKLREPKKRKKRGAKKKGTKGTKKRKKKGKKTARKREVPKSVKQRERLAAKLFDKRTLKRVSKTLEQMQKARSQRKFANQFNYALERK